MNQRPGTAFAGALLLGLLAATPSCTSNTQPANTNAATNTKSNNTTVVPGPSDPSAPTPVNFVTKEDHVTIAGDLYLPDKTEPAPAVLALHQWDADRSTYKDFAKAMRDA